MAQRRSVAIPDATVLLLGIAALVWLLAQFVPAGQFSVDADGLLIAGSYQSAAPVAPQWFAGNGQPGFINVLFDGLVSGDRNGSAIGIIAFLLIVGGAFGIINASGALERAMLAAIHRAANHQDLILPLLFLLFSLGGAVFGMGEEAIAFCLILAPLLVRLGYDSLLAVVCSYVATQVGFAASWMNPFSVAIAQGIAKVPLLSGASERMVLWALFTLIGMGFVWWYGRRLRHNPQRSICYQSDNYWREQQSVDEAHEGMDWADKAVLLTVMATVVWIGWGVMSQGYYIAEIAAQFFAAGLLCALWLRLAKRVSVNQLSDQFIEGASGLMPAILVVALAKGVVVLLGGDDADQPSLLNALLYGIGQQLTDLSLAAAAVMMLWFQSAFNVLVSSGSGQAALTMPIMAPLADLLGLSRQIAVLAFQLGDGLTNIIIPTSASLVGCLGVARVSWGQWVRFIWPFTLGLLVLSSVVMVVAVMMEFS